jgi:hypothetical protein
MGAPGSQIEPQVVTPQPTNLLPTEGATIVTEVVVIDPATDPYVATLTAYPTFPPGPDPELMTRVASQPSDLPIPTPLPTLVISKMVNLAEGLPDGEIYVAIVQRADGTYEKYLLPRAPLEAADDFFAVQNEMLNLGPQDKFIDGYTLATPPPRGIPPPNPTFEEESTVTPVAAP